MTNGEKFIEAIKMFEKKQPGFLFYAEHDIIYGPSYELFNDVELTRLQELGWHESDYEAIGYFC